MISPGPIRQRASAARVVLAAGCVALAASLAGCVTFYQPLVSLQKPVVVDPTLANFAKVRMLIRCIPGDYLSQQESDTVCRNLRTLFQNQGAQVTVEVPNPGGSRLYAMPTPPPDLVMELRSRMLHREDNIWLWVLSAGTCTIVPGVTDDTFATDVVVRDSTGALLASETLQGRFQRYVSILVWSINEIMDVFVRSDEEQVTGDAPAKDFSRDFYGQLTQVAFNANMRSLVMHGYTTEVPSPSAPVPPAPLPGAARVGPQTPARPQQPSPTPMAPAPPPIASPPPAPPPAVQFAVPPAAPGPASGGAKP